MAILQTNNDVFTSNLSGLRARDAGNAATPNEYAEVGLGKPLCIEIVNIYTGDAPARLFGGKPNLLVVSGVKGPETYDEAQKAINQLKKEVSDRSYLPPEAFSKGSPIVYYTPALEANELLFSFHLVAESFKDKVFKDISKIFDKATKLPLFITSNTRLISGTSILKMARQLGKAVLESEPFLQDNLTVRLDVGGFCDFQPGIMLICEDDKADKLSDKYKIKRVADLNRNENYFLVDKQTEEKYRGDIPFLLINVDGRERRDLVSFKPKIASAAMIKRFYGTDEGQTGVKVLEEAMELHNDLTYVNKVKDLKEEMDGMEEGSEEFTRCQSLVDAYRKNIQNDVFIKGLEDLENIEP